jgi:hypothetical protein
MECMDDHKKCRKHLTETYAQHPELFPADFCKGFNFHGIIPSKKQSGFSMRRIMLKNQSRDVYQIQPSFMMPYLISETADVEKALYLRRWGVPFDALVYVFGRDAMFWYRACNSPGRNSIVGTTVKSPDFLPEDLAADEKLTRANGKRAVVATTAAQECILGCAAAENAGTEALTAAYAEFRDEALNLNPEYAPKTVNTDGWEPTQTGWKKLFPTVTVILCFLHAFLKIKDRCRRSKDLLKMIGEKVWNAYHSENMAQFSQRIRRLKEWALNSEDGPVKKAVLKLCRNAPKFKAGLENPGAHRTSNMVDRLMNYQDRVLYAMQYFHGTPESTRLSLRSMTLIWNFHPYGTRTRYNQPDIVSPFHRLNKFVYHDNWLQNLLIAGSMGGWRQ